jgi:DNA-damage-inducible protein J
MIHARIEPRLKESAERVFSTLGISTTEAIRLFMKRVELHKGLPFPLAIPNAQTIAATRETGNPAGLKRHRSFRPIRRKYELSELVARITPKNRQRETD